MNFYLLSLGFLFVSLALEAIASALALRCWLQRERPPRQRRVGLALSLGAMLLAIHHARSLELAAQVGLYDFFEAALGMGASLALAFAAGQLGARRPPPV